MTNIKRKQLAAPAPKDTQSIMPSWESPVLPYLFYRSVKVGGDETTRVFPGDPHPPLCK